VCERECVCVRARACVRAYVRTCVRVCVCASLRSFAWCGCACYRRVGTIAPSLPRFRVWALGSRHHCSLVAAYELAVTTQERGGPAPPGADLDRARTAKAHVLMNLT